MDWNILCRTSTPDNWTGHFSGVDLAYSASLMEHIQDIDTALQEIRRVLKPGGKYIWLAPNLYHYVYAASALIPNALHPVLVRLTHGRAQHDVFPAYYNTNTRKTVYRLSSRHGLHIDSFSYLDSEPHYLCFSRFAFWLGSRLEIFMRNYNSLHWQLGWILCTTIKPEDGSAHNPTRDL